MSGDDFVAAAAAAADVDNDDADEPTTSLHRRSYHDIILDLHLVVAFVSTCNDGKNKLRNNMQKFGIRP